MQKKIVTTYLELDCKNDFKPKNGYLEGVSVTEVENDAYLNFVLFTGVGLPWSWYSRLGWTEKEWGTYFAGNRVRTFLGFEKSRLIGYYELGFEDSKNAELKLFGLFPGYMGSGLGGMLLSHAVASAIKYGAGRLWLHTCTKDAPAALGNYISRGFRVFREEEKTEEIPNRKQMTKLISAFYAFYIKRFAHLDRMSEE